MDPNKSLEGFRVDTLQPKKEVQSTQKQKYKKGNAILIILIASLIGLTTGIGSAFAFGIKEMPPSSSPLDEPTAKSQVDQVEPSIKQSEIKKDWSPQKPPIDEPTVQKSPVDEPIKEEETVEDTPAINHKNEEAKSSEEMKGEEKENKSETTNQSNPEVNKTPSWKSKSTSPHNSSSASSSSSTQATVKQQPKSTVPSIKVQTDKQTVQNKSVSGSLPEQSESQTQTSKKSVPTDSYAVSSEETPDPKTKPGTLPNTAGNDLNHAVASFVVVCFSIAYLLARKETHPEI